MFGRPNSRWPQVLVPSLAIILCGSLGAACLGVLIVAGSKFLSHPLS